MQARGLESGMYIYGRYIRTYTVDTYVHIRSIYTYIYLYMYSLSLSAPYGAGAFAQASPTPLLNVATSLVNPSGQKEPSVTICQSDDVARHQQQTTTSKNRISAEISGLVPRFETERNGICMSVVRRRRIPPASRLP